MQANTSCTMAIVSTMLLVGCSGNSSDYIEASGIIEGTPVNIAAEVAGKVKDRRVDEGTHVQRGDTLVLIDDTEYQLQLKQAIANLATQEAAYRLAMEGSRKEDVLQAEAAFKTAETDYLRMKELVSTQAVTQRQYDEAYSRFVAAQQTYGKLKSGLRPEEITAARTRKEYAFAQAELLRKKVSDCAILAPSDGIVTLKGVEPGEFVTVGINVLRLTYLDKVKLTIYVNEMDLGRIRLGNAARVTIDGTERVFDGTVVFISPVAEFTPKNVQTKEERTKLVFAVRVEIPNPEGILKPGMPADARILVDSHD
jgi:HlyD family secretion protein